MNPSDATTQKPWLAHYPSHVLPTIPEPLPYASTVELFHDTVRRFPAVPAYIQMGKILSFSELDTQSNQLAAYWQSLGLKKGERVGLILPNVLQYPVALFAAHKAGLVVVPCNPLYTAPELERQLSSAGAVAVVVLENFAATLEKVLPKLSLRSVLISSVGDLLGTLKGSIVNVVVRHVKKSVPQYALPQGKAFNIALDEGAEIIAKKGFNPVLIGLDDIAFLQFTGGTTGVCKGAVLTHRNIISNVMQAKAWIGQGLREGNEIMVTALPLYHIFALTANCLTMMSMGITNLLIINARDIPAMVKEMHKHPWTILTAVNTLFNALLHHPDFRKMDFSSLRFALGGGMAVQQAVADEWKKVTGQPITQAYGLSETSPAVTINRLRDEFNGAIGLPLPSTEVSIRDGLGKELALGEVGEICVRGPQVMREYWNAPEETDKVFWENHTFRTGDMGTMSAQGLVTIVDRLKDMVAVSGFKVFPNEVEDVLARHPAVLECGVVGVPDERTGEAVRAFVVRRYPSQVATASADAASAQKWSATSDEDLRTALIAHCQENLTHYKVPKQFVFLPEIPKTNVGKVLRKELRRMHH